MDKYASLAEKNCDAFLEDIEYKSKRRVFQKLSNAFEENGVKWALTCSAQLYFKGILDNFNDYDIFIAAESKDSMLKVMSQLGAEQRDKGDQSCFDSEFFVRYTLDGVNLDLIVAYTVVTFGARYRYEYTQAETEILELEEFQIPLIATEAQYLLYGMMEGWQPQREYKRLLIEEYLKNKGIVYYDIFNRSLENYNLPSWLKRKVKELKEF